MGSMSVPVPISYLEMMANNWEILGNFMYPASAYQRLLALVRGGLLDIRSLHSGPHVPARTASRRDGRRRIGNELRVRRPDFVKDDDHAHHARRGMTRGAQLRRGRPSTHVG